MQRCSGLKVINECSCTKNHLNMLRNIGNVYEQIYWPFVFKKGDR